MKKLSLVLQIALLTALFSMPLLGQRLAVRGHVTGEDGKPLAGADILMLNKDNGQKFSMRTDKKGDFVNVGVALGVYHLSVSAGGKVLYEKDVTVSGEEPFWDIDVPKANEQKKEEALKQLTPEQRKQLEQQQKAAEQERAKVANLNQLLAQSKTAQDTGNFDQAISLLKQANQMDPTHDVIWSRLAENDLSAGAKADKTAASGYYTDAVDAYKKAIAIKPSVAGYHNNLGQAYAKLGQTDQAMAEYTTAAQLDPAEAGMYYFNLGAVLTNTGKPDEAITAFDKALAADPNRADAYYWKGVNLMGKATIGKDGKTVAPPEAVEALNKYLQLKPDGPHAQNAKDMLALVGAKVETSFTKSGGKKK
jgi:tetratricopeptide (TPR) repeat protein